MNRKRTIWLVTLLALATVTACAATADPEISSGSNWLTCESVKDCDDGRAVRCRDGYCLDSDGDRIERAEPPAVATGDAGASIRRPEPTDDAPSAPVAAGASGTPSVTERDAGSPLDAPLDAAVVNLLGATAACDETGAREPLVPRAGETCYDFPVHGVSSPDDESPFTIPNGENYNQFYFAVPWAADTVATAYGVVDDSALSIHAWLFSTTAPNAPGTVSANVLGTLLGEEARMLGAWAIGSCNVVLGDDFGLELPSSGNVVMQWHFLNDTGGDRDNRSVFRVCTAPAASRSQRVGLTILGTEYVSTTVAMSQVSGSCLNDSSSPITLLMLDPQMHRLGARATTTIERAAGGTTTVLDVPFQFDARQHYMLTPPVVLAPGDALRTACTYANAAGEEVSYGQSALQEMCFQFALSHPVGALDNGVLSLIGATNTCW